MAILQGGSAPLLCAAQARCTCALLPQWAPTLNGYARFLAESKIVYQTFEDIMAGAGHPECEQRQSLLCLCPQAACPATTTAPPGPQRMRFLSLRTTRCTGNVGSCPSFPPPHRRKVPGHRSGARGGPGRRPGLDAAAAWCGATCACRGWPRRHLCSTAAEAGVRGSPIICVPLLQLLLCSHSWWPHDWQEGGGREHQPGSSSSSTGHTHTLTPHPAAPCSHDVL